MPRWLSLWLGASLFVFWAGLLLVVVPFVLAQLVAKGETPFTEAQQWDIQEFRPNGTYISPSTYRYCASGDIFIYLDSSGRVWNHGETCAAWLRNRSAK